MTHIPEFSHLRKIRLICKRGEIIPDEEIKLQTPGYTIFMNRQVIRTNHAPAPVGPYNQAISASGQMIFVSGQIALDPNTSEIVGAGDVTLQTKQVMTNLEAVLEAANAKWENVVKVSIFLQDMNDFATVNGIYAKYFTADTAPARACVEVSRLPKDVLVEIDCIAVI
jgi:2-iminobutanoate/2-iminopropanoate deaminase